MTNNEITEIIIGSAIKVHKVLGPGLLESTYQKCLVYELKKAGLKVDVEKVVPIIYDELKIDNGYRIDILVDNRIVIELKAVEKTTDVHKAQLLTYLKLGNYKLGLLINFNVKILFKGVTRIIN